MNIIDVSSMYVLTTNRLLSRWDCDGYTVLGTVDNVRNSASICIFSSLSRSTSYHITTQMNQPTTLDHIYLIQPQPHI